MHLRTWMNVRIERLFWTTQTLGLWVRVQLRAQACVGCSGRTSDAGPDESRIIVLYHELYMIMIVFVNFRAAISGKS